MATPECFGCGESILGGLLIQGQYLCPTCETKLIQTNVSQLEYLQCIALCKNFWNRLHMDLANFDN